MCCVPTAPRTPTPWASAPAPEPRHVRGACPTPRSRQRRRFSGCRLGGSQPASPGSTLTPGRDDRVDAVEQLARSARRRSRESCDSSCSIVRGPMIADVTAGWSSTNASARCDDADAGVVGQRHRAPRPASSLRCVRPASRARTARARRRSAIACDGVRVTPRAVLARRASRRSAGSTGSRRSRTARTTGSTSRSMPAGEDRVRRLLAHEALAVRAARRPTAPRRSASRRERRRAEVADLALVHEVGQRAERLVDVGVGSGRWIW